MADQARLELQGPAGKLESVLDLPDEVTAIAVVCHPHPLHAGTMLNKVAHTLARAMCDVGAAALRFNFRGVGNSEGEHDEGRGEVDDALAAVAAMRARYPDLPLYLCGFSFGGRIAALAAPRAQADALITVSPAMHRSGVEMEVQPDMPWLIVQGGADDVVDSDEVVAWVDDLEPGPELIVLEGVDHFFHGKLTVLRRHVVTFIEREVS